MTQRRPNLLCDVCGQRPVAGVYAMPGVPISFAYCQGCLDASAHPLWAVVANTALCGGYDETAGWWQQLVDDTLAHLGVDRDEFDRRCRKLAR